MELISSIVPTAIELLPPLSPWLVAEEAANDTCDWIERELRVHDLNLLVSEVAGRVARHLRPGSVDIELSLCPNSPDTLVAPETLAFVISGILVNQLRSLDDSENGIIRIGTMVGVHGIRISILANGVPPLDSVRAINDVASQSSGCDRMMMHCRKLIEGIGGWIDLRDDREFLGFELHLPSLPLCNPAGLQSPKESKSTTVEQFEGFCLAG